MFGDETSALVKWCVEDRGFSQLHFIALFNSSVVYCMLSLVVTWEQLTS